MRTRLTVLVVGSLAVIGVANAEADSTAAASAPVASEPAAVRVVPATPAEAPATAAAPQKSAARQPVTLKMATVPPPADFKIPAVYQAVNRGLDTVCCTSITPVGSRIPQTFCLTLDQVIERKRQAEIAQRDVALKTSIAGTGGGPRTWPSAAARKLRQVQWHSSWISRMTWKFKEKLLGAIRVNSCACARRAT